MLKILKNRKITIKLLLIIIGLIGGYAYWYFIGCSSNSCPITSKWYLSTIYGGLVGYLISSFFSDKKFEKNQSNNN